MKIYFNKYHGTGNDFILIDNREGIINPGNLYLFQRLCDRHFGIGADGLMLLGIKEGFDFEMRYFNSDGNESTMCGNGGRCIAAFAARLGIIGDEARFIASDGVHTARITGDMISLSMNDVAPPVLIDGNHFINTGSPHLIIPVTDATAVDVDSEGRRLRYSDPFRPGGTNVNFVETTPDGIFVRTYERGVEAETLSCGTGVTASAISAMSNKTEGLHKVSVETKGGSLEVSFNIGREEINSVVLTGPAEFVFEGAVEV